MESIFQKMTRKAEITHKIMSAIHAKDTKPEKMLRKELCKRNIRYRKNAKNICGHPDIAILNEKIAIFCDGDFWHGHNWAIRGYGSLEEELQRYSKYWQDKIVKNIVRDNAVTKRLQNEGWIVIRLWASDILKNASTCAEYIINVYDTLREID